MKLTGWHGDLSRYGGLSPERVAARLVSLFVSFTKPICLEERMRNEYFRKVPFATKTMCLEERMRNMRNEYFERFLLPGGTFELASTSGRFLFRQKPVPFPSSGHFLSSPRVGSSLDPLFCFLASGFSDS
jgi:hypothetical protein